MSVVVGYLAGKAGRSGLHLAVEAARTLETSLVVVTIVPQPWMTPSPAKVDAEFAAYADKLGADSKREAQRHLQKIGEGLDISYRQVASRGAGDGLIEAVEEIADPIDRFDVIALV